MPQKYVKLVEDVLKGGLADDKSLKDLVDLHSKKGSKVSIEDLKKQLEMGIKVEKEHSGSEELAREIAMDHLAELPTYYSKLSKIEKE
jgi:hypothetical protein